MLVRRTTPDNIKTNRQNNIWKQESLTLQIIRIIGRLIVDQIFFKFCIFMLKEKNKMSTRQRSQKLSWMINKNP